VIALDAVDRDGHRLVVLVDGNGDLGLGCAAGKQRQGGDGNEERTHLTFGLQACLRRRLSVPGTHYARKPV
jgi:hypothetical protein